MRTLNRNFPVGWDFIEPISINGVDKIALYDGGAGATTRILGYYGINSNGMLSSTSQTFNYQLNECYTMFPIY